MSVLVVTWCLVWSELTPGSGAELPGLVTKLMLSWVQVEQQQQQEVLVLQLQLKVKEYLPCWLYVFLGVTSAHHLS